nr:reverse transcriptase domain-containing protein [Tanacetum cinerariifolium]
MKLNLTQPCYDASDFKFKEDYTIVHKLGAIIYRDRNNQKKMMRETEVHKFSDVTLARILEKLDHMIKDYVLFQFNPSMEHKIWSEDYKRRIKELIEVIERRLTIRRIFKSLESFVSGRNLFPPLDNPELTVQRRSRSDPTLLNNSEMAAEGPGDLPVPDLLWRNYASHRDDANKHLDNFLHVTQSIKVNGVTDNALQLYLFLHSLTHHATAWFDHLPRNSINTFEQMAKMFLGKYFPPFMVTKLKNEITNFRQRPDESLFEAWERYKLSIDRCPNHNMLPVTQIDTFYNGLTLRHRDTINVAAGGTFMKRLPEECYDLIENMIAHHNDWDTSAQRSESSSSINSSSDTEIAALKAKMTEINKNLMRVLQPPLAILKTFMLREPTKGANQGQNQPQAYQEPAYQAPVYQAVVHQPQIPQPQVVTTSEFTNFMKENDAILKNMHTNMTSLTKSNLELKNMFGQFMKMNTTSSSGSRTLPVERETEATKDKVNPANNGSTKDVQPQVVPTKSLIHNSEPVNSLIIEPVSSPPPLAILKTYMLREPTKFMNMNTTSFLGSGTLSGNTVTNPKEDLKGITTRSGTAYQGDTIPTTSSFSVVERETEATKDMVHPTNNGITEDIQPLVVPTESPYLNSEPVISPIIVPVSSAFGPYIKSLLTNKDKLCELARTPLNEQCFAVLLKKLLEKLGDPEKFLIPCDFPRMAECLALADLGASINLMPLSVWNKLSLPDLSPTCMTLELADHSISRPVGVAEDVFVKVGTFHFPADFVVVDFDADPRVPLILGISFLKTRRALIDVFEEYSQEVLGFSDVIASRNPTPYYDPIVSTTSPTLTPFGNSDFLLEEVDAFLALEDDPTLLEVDESYLDSEGGILLLEAFLNDDPSLPPPNQGKYLPEVRKELKICKAKTDKSSIDQPPEVELKDLPPHLEYAFLEGDDKLPVIITKYLSVEEKTALITVLKLHKRAIS